MNTPQIITQILHFRDNLDTGSAGLDQRCRTILGSTVDKIGEAVKHEAEAAKVEAAALKTHRTALKRKKLAELSPEWVAAVVAVLGGREALAKATERSVHTVRGWEAGRTIEPRPLEAIKEALARVL